MKNNNLKTILEELLKNQDLKYRDFQIKLLPPYTYEQMIGVRTPILEAFAKDLFQNNYDLAMLFLNTLPHKYFDENQLHAFLICQIKNFETCISYTDTFLPFVDNWATCDQLSPKVFKKNHKLLLSYIHKWLKSDKTFTVRFAVGMLMHHFLDEEFSPEYLELVSKIKSSEYYINMMIAWYFATALAKQYKETIPFLQKYRLEKWTHNKAIQKATESFRISKEQKEYLKTLKLK